MTQLNSAHQLTVIYDGECDFCKECVKWVERKRAITAIPFQSADLVRYGVTYEQCSKEVVVLRDGEVLGGANAIVQLLHASGHKTASLLLRLSGPVGRTGYKWIAAHRNSALVRCAHRFVRFLNKRAK